MVHLKQGNQAAAKQALERALRISRTFPGAGEAEKALAGLSR
jgi:hypothetical protein